uniref:Baculovirus polyhedron envelope protein PEP N-terminal domain-containing protein n=1 Tax=Phthorimaea operculella granulovirus TaxID=192584 RepID=A0A481SCH4_9BBAC|nr:hypothetical protein PhopGVgp021 [Phthorimaea operculella granulovirus]QBH66116.1 hypothetical protein PhopGVgp021 [Phthorimaea operculella granulovirus]QBH66246.1 hypothetical protein PhopGVgp021 [Phthorimaea operculella granulovirus]QBH66376.1 hypothetical protein PhopGVgp021 [Phthorimaea operculella granulovirus]QBH66506.1 hypothetical protein PhopGVgp021 [Phthorimaea operculella granulovirus]
MSDPTSSTMSCPFTRIFDETEVPLVFTDMVLWVGADEVLRILKLSPHSLYSLPDSERTTLKLLIANSDSNKIFITALGVGLLASRLSTRGSVCDNTVSNAYSLPERANAFANIFLTDVIVELRIEKYLCNIIKKENEILELLNVPS